MKVEIVPAEQVPVFIDGRARVARVYQAVIERRQSIMVAYISCHGRAMLRRELGDFLGKVIERTSLERRRGDTFLNKVALRRNRLERKMARSRGFFLPGGGHFRVFARGRISALTALLGVQTDLRAIDGGLVLEAHDSLRWFFRALGKGPGRAKNIASELAKHEAKAAELRRLVKVKKELAAKAKGPKERLGHAPDAAAYQFDLEEAEARVLVLKEALLLQLVMPRGRTR